MKNKEKALKNESCHADAIIANFCRNNKSIDYNGGFIKLHRNILNWEWYENPNVLRVFIHCLLNANHTPKKWQGKTIQIGTFITSYTKLANSLKLSEQNIRTAINKLKITGELTYKSTSQYSIITINNWDLYQQSNKVTNTQLTNN